jgi:hypothetical protein
LKEPNAGEYKIVGEGGLDIRFATRIRQRGSMRPSVGRGVRLKVGRAIQSLTLSVMDGLDQIFGVQVVDD